jgi:hypothetical protein
MRSDVSDVTLRRRSGVAASARVRGNIPKLVLCVSSRDRLADSSVIRNSSEPSFATAFLTSEKPGTTGIAHIFRNWIDATKAFDLQHHLTSAEYLIGGCEQTVNGGLTEFEVSSLPPLGSDRPS